MLRALFVDNNMVYSFEQLKAFSKKSSISSEIDKDELLEMFSLIDIIKNDGSTFFLKADGERSKDTYLLMISGGLLGDDYIRDENSDLISGLAKVISEYANRFWQD